MSQNQNNHSGVQTIPVNADNHSDHEAEMNEEKTQDNQSIDADDNLETIEEAQLVEETQPQNDDNSQEQVESDPNPADDTDKPVDITEVNDTVNATENNDKSAGTDWKDAYIRLAADFDNYRKRTSKEQDDIRRRERERVVSIWLEVYDNAERALDSMAEKSGPWHEGFSSLIQQMDKALAQLNIKVVNDVGEKFDPKRHEAISIVQDPSKENNTIVYVMQKGFIYENGDVARIAKVVVVKNPS